MQRRDFIKKTTVLGLGLSAFTIGFAEIKKWYDVEGKALEIGELAGISNQLEGEINSLFAWMKSNGWTDYLQRVLGVNLDLAGDALKKELIKELDRDKLTALRNNIKSGYDDFSGERLVQPGFPNYSLLYHTIASPRVRPEGIKEYPSLPQIDLLENYIYALCNFKTLKSIYGLNSNKDLVFAVFAYEYRPAFKTPHHAYADLVYSRTGIARIGDEPLNYDKVNRCHINKPTDNKNVKNVAVIPARYGLFIARRVKDSDISLVKEAFHKGDDIKDDRNDGSKTFLQPIRKVFNYDLLVDSGEIQFSEDHKSVKLRKFANSKGITMLKDIKPTHRNSNNLIVQDKESRVTGSSFLVISQHEKMIRPAREDGKMLFFIVPKASKEGYDNRYFTAFCTQAVENVELLEGYENLVRIYNKYEAPRNQPLFVNVTNEIKQDTTYSPIPKTRDGKFEQKVNEGMYYSPLFEDSICDGSVSAHTDNFKLEKLAGIASHCLPAFSIVTAPDFFPQVDPLDFEFYDVAPGLSKESNFYEGGVASLATARIKPNPKMIDTKDDDTSDTYLAVLSASKTKGSGVSHDRLPIYRNPALERGYDISGFLPDVASSVFAPGWDVTYCSLDDVEDIYVGTEGLGSPFIEDMKFCSALNGMWPATSPDAARTYQGSNEANYRNPTAVPLLDSEIGIYPNSPEREKYACTGWDGEQGPYLDKKKDIATGKDKWVINFTDIGRADAVHNALNNLLDMSKLRELTSAELIARMECLKICINALPQKNFNDEEYKARSVAYTYLWLVSAEQVNWGKENLKALGIPANLVGSNKNWISLKENAQVSGPGYLYVFANSVADVEDDELEDTKFAKKEWTDKELKRRTLDCEMPIYVCQVTNDANSEHKIAWAEINSNTSKVKWNFK